MQTGFPKAGASPQYNYALRRTALRSSWFPSSKSALDDLHKKQGVVVRFIIGHTSNRLDEAALAAEDREFGGFLRLPIEVCVATNIHAPSHLQSCKILSCGTPAGGVHEPAKQDCELSEAGHKTVHGRIHSEGAWSTVHLLYHDCLRPKSVQAEQEMSAVQIDDDVYLRVGNLVLATQQWKRLHAGEQMVKYAGQPVRLKTIGF